MSNENDFQAEFASQRSYLLRYASLQLRNATVAEDVVQDTLVAALNGQQRFAGRSAVRTWLVGILKHKIVDAIRKQTGNRARQRPGESDRAGSTPVRRTATGRNPQSSGEVREELEQKEFFGVLGVPGETAQEDGRRHDARAPRHPDRRDL